VLLFALHTGVRMGEQRAVRWTDIDFERRIITIRRRSGSNSRDVTPAGRRGFGSRLSHQGSLVAKQSASGVPANFSRSSRDKSIEELRGR
jgi:hypothetical protein